MAPLGLGRVVEAALRANREALSEDLLRSKKILGSLVRLCGAKVHWRLVQAEVLRQPLSGPALLRLRRRDASNLTVCFVAPAACLLLYLRKGRAMAAMKGAHEQAASLQKDLTDLERKRVFMCIERDQTRPFALDPNLLQDNRNRLHRKLSARPGFVKTAFVENESVFMEAGFLCEQIGAALATNGAILEEVHGNMVRMMARLPALAADLLAQTWRLYWQRKRIWRASVEWSTRMARVRASRERFAEGAAMRAEDAAAALLRLRERSALRVQRVIRAFAAWQRESGGEAAEAFRRQRLLLKRKDDEDFKARFRAAAKDRAALAAWQCPRCEKLGVAVAQGRFDTWDAVAEHTADHDVLAAKRAEKMEASRAKYFANLSKERAFLARAAEVRNAPPKRALCLLPLGESGQESGTPLQLQLQLRRGRIVLYEGSTNLGRSERRCGKAGRLDSRRWPKLVSSLHASVEVAVGADGRLKSTIEDRHSTNGTSLNGAPLRAGAPQPLHVGDVVMLGSCPDSVGLRNCSDVVFRVGSVLTSAGAAAA